MPVPQQNSRRSDVCFGGKYTIVELVAWISADFLCIESGAAELVAGQVQVDTTPINRKCRGEFLYEGLDIQGGGLHNWSY
jgi:hypothetical protein